MTGKALNRRGLPKGTPLVDGKNERAVRQDRAHERLLAREDRSPRERLRALDRRLGTAVGAHKERAQLLDQRHVP